MSFAPESKISAGAELLELVNLMPARIEEVDKMKSLGNDEVIDTSSPPPLTSMGHHGALMRLNHRVSMADKILAQTLAQQACLGKDSPHVCDQAISMPKNLVGNGKVLPFVPCISVQNTA